MEAARLSQEDTKSDRLPEWARQVEGRFRERNTELVYFVDLTWRGYSMVANYPDLITVIWKGEPPAEEDQADLKESRKLAAASKKQLTAGMPLLHGLAVAWVWTSLETFVEEMAVELLRNRPEVANRDGLRDLKLPLSAAVSGDPEQLARAIYEELELKRGLAFKSGLTRFEGMFSALGVGGAVAEGVGKLVWELGQVRNVILHRGGVVDEQFASACPWTGMVSGQQLVVTRNRCLEYVLATTHYSNIIRSRLSLTFGPPGSTPVEADATVAQADVAVAGHDQVVEDLDVEQARGERVAPDAH
jgi:hypothetical protein